MKNYNTVSFFPYTALLILISCQIKTKVETVSSPDSTHIENIVSNVQDDSSVYEDYFNLDTYLTNELNGNAQTIDNNCAILIYPNDKQIEEAQKEYGEDFAIIADDDSWYEYQSNHLLDSLRVKVVVTNNDYLKLVGNSKSWTLDIKRKGLPMWNLIFFKKDKEPKIMSMPGLTTEEITNFFN